jgi:valyl-tRNA synthetase
MNQPFPLADESKIDAQAVLEMEWVKQFILGIRKIKGEMNIAPGKPVPVLLSHASDSDKSWAETHRAYLDFLARTESIEVLPEGDEGPESATALVGDMKVLIPMAGLIDKEAELARLEKEMGKLQQDAERTEKKLSNPSFVDKAPDAVVQKERHKLEEAKSALAKLEEQAAKIRSL